MCDPEFRRLACIEWAKTTADIAIRKALRKRRMSNADLARALDKSPSTIARLLDTESGARRLDTLADVARVLGYEVQVRFTEPKTWKYEA